MRLIDAEELERLFNEQIEQGATDAFDAFDDALQDAPTVDAVVVTRCKDCKHLCMWNRKDIYAFCPKTNIVFLPFDKYTRTFFCSLGERKDGGDG
jgi:hypothetical protein|nr:MAG TPA: hypothetical protein [Caudoviricetes sp.]